MFMIFMLPTVRRNLREIQAAAALSFRGGARNALGAARVLAAMFLIVAIGVPMGRGFAAVPTMAAAIVGGNLLLGALGGLVGGLVTRELRRAGVMA